MALRCGDDRLVVGAGHWVSMPRGVTHTFRVVDDPQAGILMVHDNATLSGISSAPWEHRPTERVVPPNQPSRPRPHPGRAPNEGRGRRSRLRGRALKRQVRHPVQCSTRQPTS
jgi:hypothetical protein